MDIGRAANGDPTVTSGGVVYDLTGLAGTDPRDWGDGYPQPSLYAVNAHGEVIGAMMVNGVDQPVLIINGVVHVLTVPGAAIGSLGQLVAAGQPTPAPIPVVEVILRGINNQGSVVGQYTDASGHTHGLLYENGRCTAIDVPGGTHTTIATIDDAGTISGDTFNAGDTAAMERPFTLSPAQYRLDATPLGVPPTPFMVADQTTQLSQQEAGTPYQGPVAGITREWAKITTDNLNLTVTAPNCFIHTGSGDDAIDVSHAGGANILDGGTGSNFLVGGTGADTFFADDRSASAAIWSTVAGFHAGDHATIWGLTSTDFQISMLNDLGAAGYTGLTIQAMASGKPTCDVTLAGYTKADLGGKLTVSFGMSPDMAGVAGSPYMMLTGH